MLRLQELDPKLRERIVRQMRDEDVRKVVKAISGAGALKGKEATLINHSASILPEDAACVNTVTSACAGSQSHETNSHLGRVENPKPEHGTIPPLAGSTSAQARRAKGVDQVCVTIVSFRSRRCDEDNLAAGAKSLRDQIALSLGVDDGDQRIRWEVTQVETRAIQGTLVKISA